MTDIIEGAPSQRSKFKIYDVDVLNTWYLLVMYKYVRCNENIIVISIANLI